MVSKKFKVGNGNKAFCVVFLIDNILYYEYHEKLESAQKAYNNLVPRHCEKCIIVERNNNNEFEAGELLLKNE